MRIAIIGTGISGLVVARELHALHDVSVFEAANWIGGHAHTVSVEHAGRTFAVDTGFVVFNNQTYPHFTALLDELGVASRSTSMSFSVREDATGFEYCGTSMNAVFAQRSNLFRPSFHRMLADVIRFNREAAVAIERAEGPTQTLAEFLDRGSYGEEFRRRYLLPMGAAIWSSTPQQMMDFPFDFFARFFANHGLLSTYGQLQWRSIVGGSRTYVDALVEPFRDRIRLRTPVRRIVRRERGVDVVLHSGKVEHFDEIVMAVHSDQALAMLDQPSAMERRVLGAIGYQRNEVALHTDASLLPRRRRARASWNYHIPAEPLDRVLVTYDMSRLQGIRSPSPFCVTLNWTERIDPRCIVRVLEYSHPVFTPEAIRAQASWEAISGVDRVHYCGAYWRNGFHEDGVVSGLAAAKALMEREEVAA